MYTMNGVEKSGTVGWFCYDIISPDGNVICTVLGRNEAIALLEILNK
jgi:hypothetical protein